MIWKFYLHLSSIFITTPLPETQPVMTFFFPEKTIMSPCRAYWSHYGLPVVQVVPDVKIRPLIVFGRFNLIWIPDQGSIEDADAAVLGRCHHTWHVPIWPLSYHGPHPLLPSIAPPITRWQNWRSQHFWLFFALSFPFQQPKHLIRISLGSGISFY